MIFSHFSSQSSEIGLELYEEKKDTQKFFFNAGLFQIFEHICREPHSKDNTHYAALFSESHCTCSLKDHSV
jgi:hypothetical protein